MKRDLMLALGLLLWFAAALWLWLDLGCSTATPC